MPSTSRSKTPGTRDKLFDISKVVKRNVPQTSLERNLSRTRPNSLPRPSTSAPPRRSQSPAPRNERASASTRERRPYSDNSAPEIVSRARGPSAEIPKEQAPLRMRRDKTPTLSARSPSNHSADEEPTKQSSERELLFDRKKGPTMPKVKHSASAKLCRIGLSIVKKLRYVCLITLAVVSLCAIAYALISFIPFSVQYCDADIIVDDCTPCPKNGVCTAGNVVCQPGFEERGAKCVEDRRLASRAKVWMEHLEHHLAYLNGAARCDGDETGMMEEDDVKKHLADTYGGTYLEETFAYLKENLPATLRRTGTVYDTPRIYIPFGCRIERVFWVYVPPVLALLTAIVIIHSLWNRRQNRNKAYALVKNFIENQTTVFPRLSGPSCADITHYGITIGLKDAQCRELLRQIARNETSVRSSPNPFNGNALMYWSQTVVGNNVALKRRAQ